MVDISNEKASWTPQPILTYALKLTTQHTHAHTLLLTHAPSRTAATHISASNAKIHQKISLSTKETPRRGLYHMNSWLKGSYLAL